MTKKQTILSTVTNAAYGIAGIALLQISYDLLMPAVFLFLLMIGSGIHHWNIGARKLNMELTRALDYFGMYGITLALISLSFGAIGLISGIVDLIIAAALAYLFKGNRTILGILFGITFIALCFATSVLNALTVGGWLALAFGFNFIADQVHREKADLLHGIPWHIPSAVAAMKAAVFLYDCMINCI